MTSVNRQNNRVALIIVLIVVGMVGLSFASVPLYRLFCQVTGLGGTTQTSVTAPGKVSDRVITVSFDTRVDTGLPWQFKSETRRMDVHVGQQALVSFRGTNRTARQTAGTALYNVTPEKVGKYFNKTQCFCFARQELGPGKSADFPVMFFIDPAILDDPEMNDVTDIVLSYTFFPADSQALDDAMSQYGEQK